MSNRDYTKASRFLGFRNSACAAAMMLALTACVPTDNASNEQDNSKEFVQAQSQFYANAIQQYSLQSQHALTNAATWAAGAVSEGSLDLTSAEFNAIDLGGAEVYIESAYCKTSGDDALHLTWFDSADADGQFVMKGVGPGNSGFIISALREDVSIDNLGIFDGTGIKMSDGSVQTIPATCGSLSIPNGSPVLLTSLSLPTGFENDMVRYEYRTVSCASGESGAVQQQIQVTYHADGSRTPQGGAVIPAGDTQNITNNDSLSWITTSNTCAADVTLASYDVTVGTSAGIDFNALMTSSGVDGSNQVAQVLNASLSNMECRRVLETIQDGEEIDDADRQLFETCGVSVELAALQSLSATALELIEEEIVTKPCGGTPGTFEDSVDGDMGIATYPAWSGEAVYKREVWSYSVATTTSAGGPGPGCGDCEEIETVEKWTGLSLECSREEVLKIECETRLPVYSDRELYTPVTAGGFIYNRINSVSGWADAENLVPNEPDNPDWTGDSYDCSWRKDLNWDCSAFPELREVSTGSAWRLVEVVNIIGEIEAGPWTIEGTAQCAEDTTWDCSAYPTMTELREGRATKITEILNPEGETEVGDWVIEQTAQCSETREFTCPAGTVVQTGIQDKILEILNPAGDTSGGTWTTTRNSSCKDTRTTGGCEVRTEERNYTGTAPYVGSWTPWTVISIVDDCGSSGETGGTDVCIMAGAKVVMADGSVKAIEKLEVGDVTVTGRVLQKFARHYDESRHATVNGRWMVGESLFEVDGIVATGRHAYLSKDGWTELSDSQYADVVSQDVAMLYNMVMENHVIPVMGDSGEIHYYADELNNLGGVSEKAMAKLTSKQLIAA